MTFLYVEWVYGTIVMQVYQGHGGIPSTWELVREESTMLSAILERLSAFQPFYKDVFCKG